jgi:hypothetical protein
MGISYTVTAVNVNPILAWEVIGYDSNNNPIYGWVLSYEGGGQDTLVGPFISPPPLYVPKPIVITPESGFSYTAFPSGMVVFKNQSVNCSSYVWNFGDGSATSNAQNPNHQYPYHTYATQYVVSLTATGAGKTSVTSNIITVPTLGPPMASCYVAQSGLAVSCNNTSNFVPTVTAWDFGDGSTDTGSNVVHFYSGPGEYVITMGTDNGLKAIQTILVEPPTSSWSPITWEDFTYAQIFTLKGETYNIEAHNVPYSTVGGLHVFQPNAASAESVEQISSLGNGVGIIGFPSGGIGVYPTGGSTGAPCFPYPATFGLANGSGLQYYVSQWQQDYISGAPPTTQNLNIFDPSGLKLSITNWDNTLAVSIAVNANGLVEFRSWSIVTDMGGNFIGWSDSSTLLYTSTIHPTPPLFAKAVLSESDTISTYP